MQINEDGSVTLDFNATLEIARDFHRKYTRAHNVETWYRNNISKLQADKVAARIRYQHYIDRYGAKAKQYEKWETLYQLLLKNKRLRKSDSNDVEGCNNKLQDSKNDD